MTQINGLSLRWRAPLLEILDQTKLPHQEVWLKATSPEVMIEFIQKLKVRGAPLIALAAAFSLAQFCRMTDDRSAWRQVAKDLRKARPTAVNLMRAMDRMLARIEEGASAAAIEALAEEIFLEDRALCDRIADNGAHLIETGDRLLTHCNTGGLATGGQGTALGLMVRAHNEGRRFQVWVDETRPLLQGARLTTWELSRHGIEHTLICDNMAAMLMAGGQVDKVIVGADRIAANGDFANKVGTYGLAVLAAHHRLPFYVVAPATTVDLRCPSGKEIPIEQRPASEVRCDWAPAGVKVFNPAFDVTPASLVTAWILDTGLYTLDDIRAGRLKD